MANKITEWLNKIASSFQPKYDLIKKWKWSAQQQVLIDKIWENLSPTIQKALWSLVALILAKYGPEAAQSVLASVLNQIKANGWVIES